MFCKSSILSFYLYFLSFLLVCLSSSHTVLWVIRPQPRTLAAREAPLGFFFFFLQLIIQSWRFHLWRWCPFATWLNNWISQQQQWEREFVFGLAISQNNSPEAETEMMRTGEENGEKKKKANACWQRASPYLLSCLWNNKDGALGSCFIQSKSLLCFCCVKRLIITPPPRWCPSPSTVSM